MKRKVSDLPVELVEKILMYTNIQTVKIAEFNYMVPYIEKHVLENIDNLLYCVSNKRQRLNRIGESVNIISFLEARDLKQHIRKTLFNFKTTNKTILQEYQKVKTIWSQFNIGCDSCFSYNKKLETCLTCFKDLCCIETTPCTNCHLTTCSECKYTCYMCKGTHCTKCKSVCAKTYKTLCNNCIDSCIVCKKTFTSESVYSCSKCKDNCCIQDINICKCNKLFCSYCSQDCNACDTVTCNECSVVAENKIMCTNCFIHCMYCGIPLLYDNLYTACVSCYYDSSIVDDTLRFAL
jgi:hypothetical protein